MPKCLDSLVASKYLENLDIIVVSDGSPDNSLNIAYNYQKNHPGVFNVIDKPNGGHGSTINRGIKEAKGRYFRVLDSDDWFDTDEFDNYLEKLSKVECDLVLSDTSKVFAFDNYRKELIPKVSFEPNVVIDADKIDYTSIIGDIFITMSKVAYSVEVLRKSGLELYEKCFYVDVQYSLFVYSYVNSVVYFDNNVYQYFIGRPEQSVSTEGYKKHYKDSSKVMLSCAEYAANHKFVDSAKDRWVYDSLIQKASSNYINMRYLSLCVALKESKSFSKKLKTLGLLNIIYKKDKRVKLYKFSPVLFFLSLKLKDFLR